MKKKHVLSLIWISGLMLLLAACGSKSPDSSSTNTDRLNANYENALPVETQLVLGTFKLEGTKLAVDSKMASQLVPLYTLLQQMSTSNTAAQAEIDALLDQIQGTMTPDQIHAIAAMKQTQTDLTNYIRQSGGTFQGTRTGTPGAGFSNGGGFPGGAGGEGGGPPAGFPGGGGGGSAGGGFGGNGGSNLSQNQIATLRAQRTGTPGFGGGTGTPAFLINQLIQLLQKKSQSVTPTQ
jgi:hypothetical protein